MGLGLYLDDIVSDIDVVIEDGPLEGMVAIPIGLRDGAPPSPRSPRPSGDRHRVRRSKTSMMALDTASPELGFSFCKEFGSETTSFSG